MRALLISCFVMLAFPVVLPWSSQGQIHQPANPPDQFEFIEGHAYMGSDRVEWKQEKLVFTGRVADMKGQGHFDETIEQVSPTPEAWERFWVRVESLGVWQWKADYSDPKRHMPDGESWALTLQHGAKQVKAKGYNGVPDGYSAFRAAIYELREDARRQKRE